jgi:hypothetical protein
LQGKRGGKEGFGKREGRELGKRLGVWCKGMGKGEGMEWERKMGRDWLGEGRSANELGVKHWNQVMKGGVSGGVVREWER